MSAKHINLFLSEEGGRHRRHRNATGEPEEGTMASRLNNYGIFPQFLLSSPVKVLLHCPSSLNKEGFLSCSILSKIS